MQYGLFLNHKLFTEFSLTLALGHLLVAVFVGRLCSIDQGCLVTPYPIYGTRHLLDMIVFFVDSIPYCRSSSLENMFPLREGVFGIKELLACFGRILSLLKDSSFRQTLKSRRSMSS